MSCAAKVSNDVLQAIQTLSKMIVSQPTKSGRCSSCRFPYMCKNGDSCPFHALGCCWFMHDNVQKSACSDENEQIQSFSPKLKSEFAKVDKKIEQKLGELSNYINRRCGEMD